MIACGDDPFDPKIIHYLIPFLKIKIVPDFCSLGAARSAIVITSSFKNSEL
jgi:hypothetical protein